MNTNPGIIGKKLGNTQIYSADGNVQRVTVIEAGPITVISKRTKEKDGYVALVLGMGERKEKHTNKAQLEVAKKANQTPKRVVKELRCTEEFAAKFEVGGVMKIEEIFTAGQKIDAQGRTRGRGFTGVMRRWSFAGGVGSHGTHEYFRHGGSIGTNMTPGRTLPNIKMAGHYGDEVVSMQNLKVAQVIPEKHLLLIEGGIPGAKGSTVLLRHAVKTRARKAGR
jgi:large subunit ribosomal protein L3